MSVLSHTHTYTHTHTHTHTCVHNASTRMSRRVLLNLAVLACLCVLASPPSSLPAFRCHISCTCLPVCLSVVLRACVCMHPRDLRISARSPYIPSKFLHSCTCLSSLQTWVSCSLASVLFLAFPCLCPWLIRDFTPNSQPSPEWPEELASARRRFNEVRTLAIIACPTLPQSV